MQNFANLDTGAPLSPRIFLNIFQKQFLAEILWKNPNRVWDETWQTLAQMDEYLVSKWSNSFREKQTFLSIVAWWLHIHYKSCETNLRLKSQPQLNTNNKGSLVNISNQNTQGIRRNNSKTESKHNWKTCFSEIERPCFHPYIFLCVFFLGVPPWLDTNDIWKYMCKCFWNLSA